MFGVLCRELTGHGRRPTLADISQHRESVRCRIHTRPPSGLPNVAVQIAPNVGLTGSVYLLAFDNPGEPGRAFTESVPGLLESQDPGQILEVGDVARHASSPQGIR
ncbi:hypothetical protein [Kibdelosporangium phytohabitans]|uniref:hypothetical protein n=1 Tax=Kibdelosporangium phytohabitans TaxID=860235 RepID=UPI0012F7CB40|nr:hypothetical protein [Kibdelosporangium phytohabitans]MBE1469414.1 hypothetical protein [Kibdelosporangium phytohabitans]